jgi:hypothetical protein
VFPQLPVCFQTLLGGSLVL